jgi:hypothetical protein
MEKSVFQGRGVSIKGEEYLLRERSVYRGRGVSIEGEECLSRERSVYQGRRVSTYSPNYMESYLKSRLTEL